MTGILSSGNLLKASHRTPLHLKKTKQTRSNRKVSMQYVLYIIAAFGLVKFIIWLRLDHRPTICVCKHRGFIAVALRKDYDAASRTHWLKFRKNPKEYESTGRPTRNFGQVIDTPNTFVFRIIPGVGNQSEIYEAIARRCFVEKAELNVPTLELGQSHEKAALIHIFKGQVAFNLAGQRIITNYGSS